MISNDSARTLLEVIGGAIHSIGQTEGEDGRVRRDDGSITTQGKGPRQRSVTSIDAVAPALLRDSQSWALVQTRKTEIGSVSALIGAITEGPKLSRRSDLSTRPRHQLILLCGIEKLRSRKVGSYIL